MNFQKKNVILFGIILIICNMVYGSFEKKGAGTQFTGCGSAGIADTSQNFSLFNNPALIVYQQGFPVGAFMRNYYQIKDLNQINIHSGFNAGNFALAFGVQRYGNKLYSETEIRAGIGYRFFNNLVMGYTINYYSLYIERYFETNGIGMDLGIQYSIHQQFSIGCLFANFNEPKIGSAAEVLPRIMTLGLCYYPLEAFGLMLDIVKEDKFDFDYRFGIHYRINNWFLINCGFRELSNSFTTGFQLTLKEFRAGYALEYHQTLNLSHSFEVQYAF